MVMNFEHGLVANALSPEGGDPNGSDKDKNLEMAAAPAGGDDLNDLEDIKGPHKDESNFSKSNENAAGKELIDESLVPLEENNISKPSRLPLTKEQLEKWNISPDDYLSQTGLPETFDMNGFSRVTDTEEINGKVYFHAEKDNGKWVICDSDGNFVGPEFDTLSDLEANQERIVNENNQ